jgi:hypothetical protein
MTSVFNSISVFGTVLAPVPRHFLATALFLFFINFESNSEDKSIVHRRKTASRQEQI